MKQIINTIRKLLQREYYVVIYDYTNHPRIHSFSLWSEAVSFARSNTTLEESYEIEMRRNDRFRWTTGVIIGGPNSKLPKKGGLL